MKKLFFILSFLFPVVVVSQNSGYAGKHFIIKTDALNGRFLGGRNAEIEVAVLRRLSIFTGFRYQKGNYKQNLNARDVGYITNHDYGYIGSYDQQIKNLPKATIKAYTVKLGVKCYHSRVISAPKGFYTYMSFEAGKASIDNTVQLGVVYNSWGGSVEYFTYSRGPSLSGINVKQYELGWGYQEVLFGFLTLEGSFGFNLSRFNGNGSVTTQQYTTAVASYYGPNLLPFGKNMTKYGGGHSTKPHEGAFGFAAFIKVGFLLF